MRLAAEPTSCRVRRARFEDVPDLLRLIERAIERGCRNHYTAAQRRAVLLGYLQSLFVEVTLPFATVVAEVAGQMVGMAQLDPRDGRLRALFVDGVDQGRGLGSTLLGWAEDRARTEGLPRLHGAMSLNAVPFYTRAGFHPYLGNRTISHGGVPLTVIPMEKLLTG